MKSYNEKYILFLLKSLQLEHRVKVERKIKTETTSIKKKLSSIPKKSIIIIGIVCTVIIIGIFILINTNLSEHEVSLKKDYVTLTADRINDKQWEYTLLAELPNHCYKLEKDGFFTNSEETEVTIQAIIKEPSDDLDCPKGTKLESTSSKVRGDKNLVFNLEIVYSKL